MHNSYLPSDSVYDIASDFERDISQSETIACDIWLSRKFLGILPLVRPCDAKFAFSCLKWPITILPRMLVESTEQEKQMPSNLFEFLSGLLLGKGSAAANFGVIDASLENPSDDVVVANPNAGGMPEDTGTPAFVAVLPTILFDDGFPGKLDDQPDEEDEIGDLFI